MKKVSLNSFFSASLAVLFSLSLVGCMSVKYPQRQTYMLQVRMPAKVKHTVSDDKLEVVNFSILPQYSTLSFIYRLNNLNFIQDYYNLFFVAPAVRINQLVAQYLKSTKVFKYVTTSPGETNPDYKLYGKVTRLYADYRHRATPKAAIAISFVLVKSGKHKDQIVMHKTYTANVPLARKDTISLVNGWNRGLQIICQHLAHKLHGIVSE